MSNEPTAPNEMLISRVHSYIMYILSLETCWWALHYRQ